MGQICSNQNEETIHLKCVEFVEISSIYEVPSTIPGDKSKTIIRIKGLDHRLMFRGGCRKFKVGDMVSIIYKKSTVHGFDQVWIYLIDTTDLNSLVKKFLNGESHVEVEQNLYGANKLQNEEKYYDVEQRLYKS